MNKLQVAAGAYLEAWGWKKNPKYPMSRTWHKGERRITIMQEIATLYIGKIYQGRVNIADLLLDKKKLANYFVEY